MPKTGRLTGPSKADGTQVQERRLLAAGVDVDLVGSGADFTIAGGLSVAGDMSVAGQPLSLLVAGEPTEVDLDTVGDTTTLTLLDTVARTPVTHRSGRWYTHVAGANSSQTTVQNQLCLFAVILRAGTLDGLGINCTTLAASSSVRLGVYADDDGLPNVLIAEADAAADTTGTGALSVAITAEIPTNGLYWLAYVAQGGTPAIEAGPAASGQLIMPPETAIQTSGNYRPCLTQASVTGALPSLTTASGASGTRGKIYFKYA